jgi:hypothetical protein
MTQHHAILALALLAGACVVPSPPGASSGSSEGAKEPPPVASPSSPPPAPSLSVAVPEAPAPAEPKGPPVRPYTHEDADYNLAPHVRVRVAREHKLAEVKELFTQAGVGWPPEQLLLRTYKHEREMEIWATSEAGEPLAHVTTYGVCAASGVLGPKRREGDRQVPEGYYGVQYFYPGSAYYLAMKVDYPNTSDRILGDKNMPGSDILIHGACASIGCISMSDERSEEIYVMAEAVPDRRSIAIHVFPARDRAVLATAPDADKHAAFWDNIYEGHDLFEKEHKLPKVKVLPDGRYSFTAAE